MHKYVYVRQFGKGNNNNKGGRVGSKTALTYGAENADDLADFITQKFPNKSKSTWTVDDNGKLITSDKEILDKVRADYNKPLILDDSTLGGKIATDLANEVPSMCGTIIRAIVNRIGSHITQAKIKQRAKDSKGDFTYIAPSLGKEAAKVQEQAKKRLDVASRNRAVRGYSANPKSIRIGTVLKHNLTDTELEITNIDRINTDGSIDVTYKFGDLGGFDYLKDNPKLKGEDNINLTQEDLMYFDVE